MQTLLKFSRKLEDSLLRLTSLGADYANSLNNDDFIKMLAKKLPLQFLKTRWVEKIVMLLMTKSRISLKDFF